MNTEKRFYWLWAAIGLLLLLNLATVGWVVRKVNPGRNSRRATEEIIIRRLDFTPDQIAKYRQSRSQMQAQIRPHEDSLQRLRSSLFNQIKQSTVSDTAMNQLLAQMAWQNTQITRLRFRHWQQVRSLGTPEQQARFDQLLNRLEQGLNDPGVASDLRDRLRRQL